MDNRVLLVLLLRHDDRSKPTMAETGFMGNPASSIAESVSCVN